MGRESFLPENCSNCCSIQNWKIQLWLLAIRKDANAKIFILNCYLSVTKTEKVPGIDAKQCVSFQYGMKSQLQIETKVFASCMCSNARE